MRTFLCFFVALMVLVALLPGTIWAQTEPIQPEPVAAERRPYNVRLLVACDRESFDQSSSNAIVSEVTQAAQRCAGDMWALQAAEIDWLWPVSASSLKRLSQATITERHADPSADVWFIVCVESLSMGARLSLRSWQPEVQFSSEVITADVLDRREISVVLLRLCRDLFRPMGVVETANLYSVQIRLRAGELAPPDPSFVQLKANDLLLPILAFRDKQQAIERWQSIPWTYISVDATDGAMVQGTVKSGLRTPVSGKKRSRLDTLVVAIKPQFPSTRIEMLTQTPPKLPLVAHRIEVRGTSENAPEKPDENPQSAILHDLLTDRLGQTTVTVDPHRPLVWLFAYSGEHLLVRVPCVPGIAPFAKLEVPDDSARLAAEADLQMLQGEVIDAVALRNTAIATIRAASRKDDWETVNQKLDLLKKHQDSGSLTDRLIAVRVAGTAAAKARKDRAAEVRINRICDDTAILIQAHLGSEKVRLLAEEMEALQGSGKQTEPPATKEAAPAAP